jgi:tetratricopeptide (TPR) repeat protein
MTCPGCGKTAPSEAVECEFCGELLVDIFGPSRPDSDAVNEGSVPAAADAEQPVAEVPVSAVKTAILPRHARFGDRYEILELIGEGGMGRVYKARDLELDRLIALKTIRREKGSDPETVRRFKQELVLARRVTHKNVVRIYDLGEAGGVKFFTMELLEGQSLKKVIQRDGRVAVPQAISMLRQMLSALEEAHEQGVIHRDLKPQNIMVSSDGTPHIMDFGIARCAESAGMTATGSVLGTPDYIAPEQVSGEATNAQTDLFSLGVILYEMLSGKVPYDADTPIGKVMMRLNTRPGALHEIQPDVPIYLGRMVLKCLEVDPALRYQSAREVLDDLEREQVDRSWSLRARRALTRRKGILGTAAFLTLFFGAAAFLGRQVSDQLAQPAETGVAVAEPVKTLAILPLVNATGSEELDWMRTGLAEMLITDISQSQYVRPVPGERVFKLMQQLELHEQSRFDEAALVSIAQLAPADSILYGQFVQLGGSVRMDLTLRDSGSGVPTPIKVEASSLELLAVVDRITEQVKQHLDLSPEQLRGDTDRPIADVATSSLEALRSYQAGLALLRQNANQAAVPFFKEATERDPHFAMAHAKLAESYLNAGEDKAAKSAIQVAQALSEEAPLPLVERYHIHAISALVNGDHETAATSYGELVGLYPEDPDLHLSHARSLVDLGRLPEALDAYQRVLELAPGYGAALLGMGRVQVMIGRPEDAFRSAEEALGTGQFDGDPEAIGLIYSILGVAERDMGKLDGAVEHLNLALEFRQQAGDRQGQARTLSNLAAIYEQRGQFDEALAAEEQALGLTQEMGNRAEESMVLDNMGLTLQSAGDLEQALQRFRESLQIEMDRGDDRELAIRLGQIADVYRIRGQYPDAVVYLEQSRIHSERSGDEIEKASNLVTTGRVKTALGRSDEAIEVLLTALAIFQDARHQQGVAETQLRLAGAYSGMGRYAEAYQALQRSLEICHELEIAHDLAEVRAHLGHFLIAVGHFDEAERELREAEVIAQEAHAEHVVSFILLGNARLERYLGHLDRASEAVRMAMERAERVGQRKELLLADLEQGYIRLLQGDLSAAERLFADVRSDASRMGAHPLAAEALTGLAETYLAKGEFQSGYQTATAAVSIAEGMTLRTIAYRALKVLGKVSKELGRAEESAETLTQAAELESWLRENMMPEHVEGFLVHSGLEASRP